MRSSFLLICCLCSLYSAFCQQDISIGKKYSIQSVALNEKREIWVYLPPGYNDTKYLPAKYPVVYLLDGDANFQSFTGIVQSLSKGPYMMIPQMIVVGILNTDRTRDLTPTNAARQAFYDSKSKLFANSGGNGAFIQFIEHELRPFVDSAFRTSGYNILNGHSFGGLTGVNILLNHTNLFNAYIIIDPSLWWDDMVMIKQADSIFQQKDLAKTSVYVAKAFKEIIPQDTTTDHQRGIDQFHVLLRKYSPKNLSWAFKYYENEDHGTIPIPAQFDGLKHIFEGHMVHVKKAIDQPEMAMQQFKTLSNRLGFSFYPTESWLDWIGNYCMGIQKKEAAISFYTLGVELYPKSKNAQLTLEKALGQ